MSEVALARQRDVVAITLATAKGDDRAILGLIYPYLEDPIAAGQLINHFADALHNALKAFQGEEGLVEHLEGVAIALAARTDPLG